MNRSTFLYMIWRRALQPLLFIFVIYQACIFLKAMVMESGTERTLVLLVSVFFIGFLLLRLVVSVLDHLIFARLRQWFSSWPASVRHALASAVYGINAMLPFAVGAMMMLYWQTDRKIEMMVLLAMVVLNWRSKSSTEIEAQLK